MRGGGAISQFEVGAGREGVNVCYILAQEGIPTFSLIPGKGLHSATLIFYYFYHQVILLISLIIKVLFLIVELL